MRIHYTLPGLRPEASAAWETSPGAGGARVHRLSRPATESVYDTLGLSTPPLTPVRLQPPPRGRDLQAAFLHSPHARIQWLTKRLRQLEGEAEAAGGKEVRALLLLLLQYEKAAAALLARSLVEQEH